MTYFIIKSRVLVSLGRIKKWETEEGVGSADPFHPINFAPCTNLYLGANTDWGYTFKLGGGWLNQTLSPSLKLSYTVPLILAAFLRPSKKSLFKT